MCNPTLASRERSAPARAERCEEAVPGVVALDDVDLEVRAGEIHAIAGENGSGKSTLVKIAYGALQPDEGSIESTGAR